MRIVELLQGDDVAWATLEEESRRGLRLRTPQGRQLRVAPDKILFQHEGESVEAVRQSRDALAAEVDVPLLWEAAIEEGGAQEMAPRALADLYFADDGPLHSSAVFAALTRDRLHFRRRGHRFAPRSPEGLEQLRQQHRAEEARRAELEAIRAALASRSIGADLADRLERWLRGHTDRPLQEVLEETHRDPARHVFRLLRDAGYLSPLADLEVLQADIRPEPSPEACRHAVEIPSPAPRGEIVVGAFSIDDQETREVDDVLTVAREGDLVRVDIDIADVAAWVQAGDPVDRDARRRASSAYLPTGMIPMLPKVLGCDRASLHADAPSPALRTSAWFDARGELVRTHIERVALRVRRRLDYATADLLLEEPESADGDALRLLKDLSDRLYRARTEAGAFAFQRPEWKVRVFDEGERIEIKRVDPASPSRKIVAEMMILANSLAASLAAASNIPVLYRVQPPPTGKLPDPQDPQAFEKMRGVLQPASFSLHPEPHAGLGVPQYVQCSSPLRRYADLVAQRQITSHLAATPPPHSADELLRVLANAEAVEREIKRVEAATSQRWALEWVSRQPPDQAHEAEVVSAHSKGYLVVLEACGARGVLEDRRTHTVGSTLLVRARRTDPLAGVLRVRPAD